MPTNTWNRSVSFLVWRPSPFNRPICNTRKTKQMRLFFVFVCLWHTWKCASPLSCFLQERATESKKANRCMVRTHPLAEGHLEPAREYAGAVHTPKHQYADTCYFCAHARDGRSCQMMACPRTRSLFYHVQAWHFTRNYKPL